MGNKKQVILEAIYRLNNFPTRSIARYLLDTYGNLFDNDFESIRSSVRYYRGESGDRQRKLCATLIKPAKETIPPTWNRKVKPYNLPVGKWLILSDLHVPFHEIKPIESAIAYGQKEKVTGVLLNGDFQDCQAVTYWPSVVRKNFMGEVMLVIQMLDFIRQEFPKAKIIYKPGNHEYRLPRYYASNAPEMIGNPLLAMETMIDFEGRGIDFLDYFQRINAGKLPIYHGHEFKTLSTAVNPARGLFLKAKKWAAVSHYHRTSEHTDTDVDDVYLTTWSFGCLSNLHPEWMPVGSNWNHGCAIVEVEKNGDFEVKNRRILANGKVV
jgi:predicted phosphodiesterase